MASPYGEMVSAWRSGSHRFDWEITVPANTTATARLPVPARAAIAEGGKPLDHAAGVTKIRRAKDAVT
jgi:alpha-L-rhamnosidase